MRTRHTTWLSTLSLITALGLGVGCSDDDKDSTTPVDAGGSDAGKDASTGGSDAGTTDSGPEADAGSTKDKTITELVVAGDDFSALETAVVAAELADTLSGTGPFTVFAPTNAAFATLLTALGKQPSDFTKDELAGLLTYHVVAGAVKSTDLKTGPVDTVSELSLWVSVDGGVTINEAKVTTADIIAKNGVIHVVDKVIVPPTIVEYAGYTGLFSSLIGAAGGFPDVVEALTDLDNPVTLFAPTDAAFTKLQTQLGTLPSGDALKSVLTYHVVPGEVLSTDLTNGLEATTANGAKVTFSGLPSAPQVNQSKIGPADIVTATGVIHVVDAVLIPPT
jgi:transforming growth factor-beta-induced protein